MAQRFEAFFYPGEDDERLPEWNVVEWEYVNDNGSRFGSKVWSTYDMINGEAMAIAKAKELNNE